MSNFNVDQVIKINNKPFTITKLDLEYGIIVGTRSDVSPMFAKGREVVVGELVAKRNGYSYNWNA